MSAVDAMFVAEQERVAYERFIEDFRDPGLWEGRRKGLRFERVLSGARDDVGLSFAAKCLVERGVDVGSMSPAEVVAGWEQMCAGVKNRWGSVVRLDVPAAVLSLPAPVLPDEPDSHDDDIDDE